MNVKNLFANIKSNFSFALQIKNCFIAAFFAFFMFIYFSCSLSVESNFSSKVLFSLGEFREQSESARTLAPQTYKLSDLSEFYFVIEGENEYAEKFTTDVNIPDGRGTVTNLSRSIWNLVLHVYSDSQKKNEVLRGVTIADTRNGDADVSFLLSTDFIPSSYLKNSGSYELTFKYDDVAAFSKVQQIKINICNAENQKPIFSSIISDSEDLAEWTSSSGFTITDPSIAAGYYYIIAQFYSTIGIIGVYSEILNIEPGRKTSDIIEMGKILYTIPKKPSNLQVHKIDSSQTLEYYDALITWKDESVNEDSFVIKVNEYNSVGTSVEQTSNLITIDNYSSYSIMNNSFGWVEGSVCYDSESYIIRLKTGKLYDFEIYSVNSLGASAIEKRSPSSDIAANADGNSYGDLTGFGVSSASPYEYVNTFAIIYALNGGVYRESLGISYKGNTKIEYYKYTGSPIYLLAPKAINSNADENQQTDWPILYFGNLSQPWTKWTNSLGGNVSQVTECKNISVSANYSLSVVPDQMNLSSGVYATFGTTEINSLYGSGTNVDGATISTGRYVTLTVDRTIVPNSNFSKFYFYVNGIEQKSVEPDLSDNIESFSFPVYLRGNYTLQVSGYYDGKYYYSQEFSFNVVN